MQKGRVITQGSALAADWRDDWYRDAVFYMLPVKSFYDSNGDGIGDFPGLVEKLDYLQDLGVSCLWLLPFSPSPLRDDGYDVTDYRAIHPAYGSMDDFQALLREAKARGMRVAAEMVINHTSDLHPWFQAARLAAPGSPLREFYVWRDKPLAFNGGNGTAGGGDSHWTWDDKAQAFYWHRFQHHQPDLNYLNEQVRDEMLKVLRFWADRGIDGLCLNGASFLVEREATRGEHLPETHEVLRYFRSQLTAEYPQLMLEAGLNAWPSETRPYFGNGDECHMAPLLALAQRMFLALRQEDREPLAELLRHTPEIPEGCQWITLLRNHDELTLSLATDEERDYLFREYASDPSMRIRGGILRRLAPLVENSRRRIELLFSLLFSLPGSPVIYYGDEIGMGDNVFLGERSGIRTPMQWSADRNAGFSTADFARLFAPPVMDATFGYEAVNVESQRRNPTSLYRWLRRLIALRKSSQALSRGKLEWLESENRRVISFVRTGTGQEKDGSVLVVANLARTSQPATLDLSAYDGMIPVEMFGRTPFPRIGSAPYQVMLGPHSFHWFRLQPLAEQATTRLAPMQADEGDDIPEIDASAGWDALFDSPLREALEQVALPRFLHQQRWFGGKSRKVVGVRISDHGCINCPISAFAVITQVSYEGGGSDTYFLPLAIAQGKAASELLQSRRSFAIATLHGPSGDAVLYDALADDEFCTTLLNGMGSQVQVGLHDGRIQGVSTEAFAPLRGRSDYPLAVVRGPATSSNSLVFFGRRLLFKLFRRLEPGTNPDFEIGRFLTEGTRFERTPKVAGTYEYFRHDGSGPFTLGILQSLVPNQGDGWSHATEELSRYFERAAGRMFGPDVPQPDARPIYERIDAAPPPSVLETIGSYHFAAEVLGKRTAEMHLALASEPNAGSFSPEPLEPADIEGLRQETMHQADRAFSALQGNVAKLQGAVREMAERLLEQGKDALEGVIRSWSSVPDAAKTRVHGDYHLGQVLWAENDYIILDFEGEPTRTVDERREKFSPLRDVAGMLRSYHYAAYAGLFSFTQDHPDDFAQLEPWADLWQQWVSAAFLASYLKTARDAPFIPRQRGELALLLDGFTLAKALYELAYELNNRPDWVRIPLSGVWQLLEPQIERTTNQPQGSTS